MIAIAFGILVASAAVCGLPAPRPQPMPRPLPQPASRPYPQPTPLASATPNYVHGYLGPQGYAFGEANGYGVYPNGIGVNYGEGCGYSTYGGFYGGYEGPQTIGYPGFGLGYNDIFLDGYAYEAPGLIY